jgi:hypothetical protein
MRWIVGAPVIGIIILSGCRTAHEVAVSSYKVATAPVNLVRHPPGESTTTVTTTTTTAPPETTATQPVRPPPSASPARSRSAASTSSQRKPAPDENRKPRTASSSPRPSSPLEFPTAKPVEGKPGYVYSPFDPDKYVDVSGYASGSKVKDPYSGKIFLVP